MRISIWIFLLLAMPAAATPVIPLEIRGLEPGDPSAAFTAIFPGTYCHQSNSDQADESCGALEQTFAGVKASYLVFVIAEKITTINVQFASDDFDSVAAALLEKYGKPTRKETERLQSRLGVTYDNRVLVWSREGRTLRLAQFGTTVNHGVATLVDVDSVNRANAYRLQKRSQRAKDL